MVRGQKCYDISRRPGPGLPISVHQFISTFFELLRIANCCFLFGEQLRLQDFKTLRGTATGSSVIRAARAQAQPHACVTKVIGRMPASRPTVAPQAWPGQARVWARKF